ncbi:ribonuclease H-like domain-containing protein [Tanacetum coccineum]
MSIPLASRLHLVEERVNVSIFFLMVKIVRTFEGFRWPSHASGEETREKDFNARITNPNIRPKRTGTTIPNILTKKVLKIKVRLWEVIVQYYIKSPMSSRIRMQTMVLNCNGHVDIYEIHALYASLSMYKARLVTSGNNQQLCVDYDETFSPVVKPATIRTILSLAASRHWHVHHLDVTNDFLHGTLSETVYMHQPLGFRDPWRPDHVFLL